MYEAKMTDLKGEIENSTTVGHFSALLQCFEQLGRRSTGREKTWATL